MHLNLYENGPQAVGFEVLLNFFVTITIQVLSLFFSCSESLMHLNLYKNGPLAVAFLLPYMFCLCFSAAISP